VLCRTIEYFRIPRNVLCVCVGKSTYARCFSGDTRVALVDGTNPTLAEMAKRSEQGELFWGYSIGPNGRIIVTLLEQPRYIGRDSLLEITLDNNQTIQCTPDHEFMRRDGTMVQAANLRPNDSLMPLYRQLFRGYEMVYQLINGHYFPTHRLADEWNIRHNIYADQANTHRQLRQPATSQSIHTLNDQRNQTNQQHYRQALPGQNPQQPVNHKITAIKELAGTHDVYCLSVPEAGNFALDAGVFVSNCGLIANVTPFEPGWEGYVTIEISNTTPLPAKIYANEGIAQVLFFEGDELPEVAYDDRSGKYQGQTGVTLPRI
jgi:hypothetical protein